MRKLLTYYLMLNVVLLSSSSFSQVKVTNLHYRNDTLSQSFELNQSFHSSVKPYIIPDSFKTLQTKLQVEINFTKKNGLNNQNNKISSQLKVYPLVNISTGYDNYKSLTYTTGLGVGVDFLSKKAFITAKFLPFYSKASFITDSIINYREVYPGTSQPLAKNIFFNSELIGVYKVNKFFTFLGGFGKNFFGDGYRSLLLSDNASVNPFFKIETSFSSIKYVNLFQVWKDIYKPIVGEKANALKYSATHYLSWNITKEFNLSIFETVVMGGKDSLSNRGFDLNYLNPVVFYRPVEYSMGSADNVLLGVNMNYKIKNKHKIYYQLILDEFLLSEIKAKSKWWANKFGMQIGYKAKDVALKNLNVQTEFNFVRPFTYSHKHPAQNYGHLNAAVAHPIGANFFEWINMASYKKNKNQFYVKLVYSAYGVDTSNVNYGQNIFNSYSNRDGNDGHVILQGLKTNVFNTSLIYERKIYSKLNLFLTAKYNYRYQTNAIQTNHNHYISIGLKSRLWNSYSDF